MLVIVSAVQVDHAGQVLSQPQSRPGHQQVSNNDKYYIKNFYVVYDRAALGCIIFNSLAF